MPLKRPVFRLEAMPRNARLRIGLLGGSFNPPHEGHVQLSQHALRVLRLDAVVWLVSPQNPLKSSHGTPPQAQRVAWCQQLLAGTGRISASGIETALGTRYTVDTLRALRRRWPQARFVWLMGSDNLASFHRWRHWRTIAATVPMAVVERGPQPWRSLCTQAGLALARWRTPRAPRTNAPSWSWLPWRRHPASSTALRKKLKH